nr:Ty3/gypsy retrotransposon protein [Tanacetum cinerariifolium]
QGGSKKILVRLAALFYWKGMRSIKMTPYQALYGRVPPFVIPYPPGSSKVVTIDELLVERDVLLRQLRQNLFTARNRMELQANRSQREVEFDVGDKDPLMRVFLTYLRKNTMDKKLAVCASRFVLRNGEPTRFILVRWLGSPPEEATWEWLSEF